MQKIFHNGIVWTGKEPESAEAFLVNDETITFVGTKSEVLSFKTEDTALIDLGGAVVLPTFFMVYKNLYLQLKQKCLPKKSQNKANSKPKDINNLKIKGKIEKEFLKFQANLMKTGVATIVDIGINGEAFEFYKEMSAAKQLKLDVIGVVDLHSSKEVMDENCRSYRKYVNHFRLSGYFLQLDGAFDEGKAWYKTQSIFGGKTYGYCNYHDEQVKVCIKSAIEEKKQLIVEANGNLAIGQMIRCFEEVLKENKFEDLYKPTLLSSGYISKTELKKLKQLGVAVEFDLKMLEKFSAKELKGFNLNPSKMLDLYLAHTGNLILSNCTESSLSLLNLINLLLAKKLISSKLVTALKFKLLQSLTINSAENFFEGGLKGSLESGKHANFLAVKGNLARNAEFDFKNASKKLFIGGEKV